MEVIGKKIGKWTVISLGSYSKTGNRRYTCRCDCGEVKDIQFSSLNSKNSLQCHSCSMKSLNKVEDIIGKTFGLWTVVSKFKNETRCEWFYDCICKCGNKKSMAGHTLKTGESKSCKSCSKKIHGLKGQPIYVTWIAMHDRCYNPKNKRFDRYGGRGITVCEAWFVLDNFIADMGDKPVGLQIDRIDNDGNYEPSNCRWVTPKENANNRSTCKNYKK